MPKFEELRDKLVLDYGISDLNASCYLCNFENEFICHKLRGECKDIEACQRIRKMQELEEEC